MPQGQGAFGLFGLQYEEVYGVSPGTPDLIKVYFSTVGIQGDQGLEESDIISGTRNPTKPGLGNIDVKGPLTTELQAYLGRLYYGLTGSTKTTMTGTGETVGAALAAPTAVINPFLQIITIASAAHGLAVGAVIQVAGITAPTALNNTYLRVMKVVDAGNFICRIPLGVSGAFTIGAGTLKKVTAPATSYVHEMRSGGMLPSFVGETGFPDVPEFFLFNGLKVGGMSLGITPKGIQKLSFNFVGSNETPSTTSFDTTATDLTKVSFTGFQIASIIEDAGGANNTLATVTGLDINLENNPDTEAGYTVGSAGKRTSMPAKKLKLSGTLNVQFDSMTLYTKAINGTETALKVTFTLGSGAGTAGNEQLEILLCELMFGRNTPTIDGDGGVTVKLPITGYYDNNAQGAALQITLKNTQPGP